MINKTKKIDKSKIFSRQAMIFNDETLDTIVNVFWIWFVWSNLALNFAKSWFTQLNFIDNDIIKQENLLNQYYFKNQIWKKKVEALNDNLKFLNSLTWLEILNLDLKLEEYFKWEFLLKDSIIVISTDNLESKQYFLKKYLEKTENFDNSLIFIIWTNDKVINITAFKFKNKHLIANEETNNVEKFFDFAQTFLNFNKEDIEEWLCWAKSAFYLGSLISWKVIQIIRDLQQNNYTNNWFFYEENILISQIN